MNPHYKLTTKNSCIAISAIEVHQLERIVSSQLTVSIHGVRYDVSAVPDVMVGQRIKLDLHHLPPRFDPHAALPLSAMTFAVASSENQLTAHRPTATTRFAPLTSPAERDALLRECATLLATTADLLVHAAQAGELSVVVN